MGKETNRLWDRRDFLRLGGAGLTGILLGGALSAQGQTPTVDELVKAPREGSLNLGEPWTRQAVTAMWADHARTGMTPLLKMTPPFQKEIILYFKNEALSPTGSLKHRVAWALVMNGLVNGFIEADTHLYEETSGNTGIGEAYFARLLGLPFTAVLRSNISPLKMAAIRQYGGRTANPPDGKPLMEFFEETVKKDPLGYNLDQFANAEKAIDYFAGTPAENMNIANEMFLQMAQEPYPCPAWIIAGAGTGGTATSIARYVRKWNALKSPECASKLLVVDPERSVLFDWYMTGNGQLTVPFSTRIEGVGCSGPVIFGKTFSLLREGVSRMIKVPDPASVAAMHLLADLAGSRVGPSSVLNFFGMLKTLKGMREGKQSGAIASIICDDGSRYADTYYDAGWIKDNDLGHDQWLVCLRKFWETGEWTEPA